MFRHNFNRSVGRQSLNGNMQPLTDEQIARVAPSVLATTAHERTSSRFQFGSTIELVQALRTEGFMPVRAAQSRVRDEGRKDFTKHIIVLRHANAIERVNEQTRAGGHMRVNVQVPEIVIVNAHDGLSSYQLHAGMFRLVCTNGLIVGDNLMPAIKIRHSSRSLADQVVQGAFDTMQHLKQIEGVVEAWQQPQLAAPVQHAFAKGALELRYDSDDGHKPITPAQVLQARRVEDHDNSLWTVFNRIQENLMRGGLRGTTRTGKRRDTAPINSVAESVRLNKALWTMAQALGEAVGVKLDMPNVIEAEVIA